MATPGQFLKRPVGRPRKVPRTREEEEEFKRRQMKAMAQRASRAAQMMRDVSSDDDYLDDDDDDDFDEDDLDEEDYDSDEAMLYEFLRQSKNRMGKPRPIKARPMESAKQNKSLMCKPIMMTKATSCNPIRVGKICQTEFGDPDERKVFMPVPFPLVTPCPLIFNVTPIAYPVPIPMPFSMPNLISLSKDAIESALKELQELYESLPPDEVGQEPDARDNQRLADILSRLELESKDVTEEGMKDEGVKVKLESSERGMNIDDQSEKKIEHELKDGQGEKISEDELTSDPVEGNAGIMSGMVGLDTFQQENLEGSTDLHEQDQQQEVDNQQPNVISPERLEFMQKIKRRSTVITQKQQVIPPIPFRQVPMDDTQMKLKYSYGVKAYKQWAIKKNAELDAAWKELCQKDSDCIPPFKPVKKELLACSASELSFYLASFVNEVTKPSGDSYCSDSIFYFCIGIQYYLYENGRTDDLFHDEVCTEFIDTLHSKLADFQLRLNNQGLLICRVTEEHLWESNFLGVQSPFALLETLIYLNTKNFLLLNIESHLGLSFSNVMKQWKKNAISSDGKPARTVYLKYNPFSTLQAAVEKKNRVDPNLLYEQLENIDNPLRCPVKLYEFYLSKCPESIKHRNDLFYLQPEPCCIPSSPVWFSSGQLDHEILSMMITRVKVVREVQESMLNQKAVIVANNSGTTTIQHSLANGHGQAFLLT